MLDWLNVRGIRTGVISNIGWTGAALRRRIGALLPNHPFEFILASSDYGLRKPDSRLFQVALEKAALKPEEVWFFGDTYDTDVKGARAAGLKAFFYQGQADGGMPRKPVPEGFETDVPVITDWTVLIELLSRPE